MLKLLFVTPAYQRFELSDICFRQRAWAIERLKENGIEAQCVVIADDKNIDIALKYGFNVVVRDNTWLGRRFNDGYEHAAKNDYDYVFPVGSDSWVDPNWLYSLPFEDELDSIVASRYYAMVRRDAGERQTLFIPVRHGVSYVVPVNRYKEVNGGRPCRDDIERGCDNSFYSAIYPIKVRFRESHSLETVAFQSYPQITEYDKIFKRWGISKDDKPFEELRLWYPNDLVNDMQRFYERQPQQAVAALA